ncbi:MAG: DUF1385 domain-containing protein [Ruminococcaceae bacterium]|nr:DUF1385 domain-containing protein [Oscillospiraceae bacterium]
MGKKTSIGGQALIEGIMMKGPYKTSMAVRKKDGTIDLSDVPEKHLRDKWKFFGLPLVRGMVNLIESMVIGYKTLMRSADISGFTDLDEEDTETPKSEKDEKKESLMMSIVMVIGTVLGVILAVALFMYLPSLIFKGVEWLAKIDLRVWKGLIEGVVKIIIFITYIALVSLEKDIKRVFMYHGAEHKTIFCYESGKELTVENVRGFKRFHPRCGTSFMFLMIVVGIVLGTVLALVLPSFIVDRNWLWVPLKILLVPLTCGVGYEIIKICGKYDNLFTRIIAAPGLWVQRLTTKEPEDDMIEIAIAAVNEVIPQDGADEIK